MTTQLVLFAAPNSTQHKKIEPSKEEKEEPNACMDRLSLISEMSVSSQTTVDDDIPMQNPMQNNISEDMPVSFAQHEDVEEEDDIKSLLRKCTYHEQVKSPKNTHRPRKSNKKKNNGWFSLLGRVYSN